MKGRMGAALLRGNPDKILAELESAVDAGRDAEANLLVEELFRMVEAGAKPVWGAHPRATRFYNRKIKEAAEAGLVQDPVDALNAIIEESGLDYGDVVDALRDAIGDLADAQAAQSWSTPDDRMLDDLGAEEDEVHVEASFGNWTAVNGDLVLGGQPVPKKPAQYVLADLGGRVPVVEEEVQVDFAVEKVAKDLKISEEVVQAVADQEGYGDYSYDSVSGDVEVWVLDPMIRKHSTRTRKHGR